MLGNGTGYMVSQDGKVRTCGESRSGEGNAVLHSSQEKARKTKGVDELLVERLWKCSTSLFFVGESMIEFLVTGNIYNFQNKCIMIDYNYTL